MQGKLQSNTWLRNKFIFARDSCIWIFDIVNTLTHWNPALYFHRTKSQTYFFWKRQNHKLASTTSLLFFLLFFYWKEASCSLIPSKIIVWDLLISHFYTIISARWMWSLPCYECGWFKRTYSCSPTNRIVLFHIRYFLKTETKYCQIILFFKN